MNDSMPDNQDSSNNKPILKVLGIEALVLLIVTIIIILLLNYFNVFSLSRISPSLFGFLPNQELDGKNSAPVNQKEGPYDTPSVTKVSQSQAQKEIELFAQQTIEQFALPQSFQATSIGESATESSSYKAEWSKADKTKVLLTYNYLTSTQDKSILITLPQYSQATSSLAQRYAVDYFKIKPEGQWKCGSSAGSNGNVRVCENFWISDGVKEGIGVTSVADQKVTAVFYCELHPGTLTYAAFNSCSGYEVNFE